MLVKKFITYAIIISVFCASTCIYSCADLLSSLGNASMTHHAIQTVTKR